MIYYYAYPSYYVFLYMYLCLFFSSLPTNFLALILIIMVYCRVIHEARCLRASRALSWKSSDSTALSVPTVVFRFATHCSSMVHFHIFTHLLFYLFIPLQCLIHLIVTRFLMFCTIRILSFSRISHDKIIITATVM